LQNSYAYVRGLCIHGYNHPRLAPYGARAGVAPKSTQWRCVLSSGVACGRNTVIAFSLRFARRLSMCLRHCAGRARAVGRALVRDWGSGQRTGGCGSQAPADDQDDINVRPEPPHRSQSSSHLPTPVVARGPIDGDPPGQSAGHPGTVACTLGTVAPGRHNSARHLNRRRH